MANLGAIFLLIIAVSPVAFAQRVCPSLKIEMPTRVLQVETEETFRIWVSDGEAKLRYTWGSSLGTIINPHLGPEMRLVVPRKFNAYNATIFVRVDGLMDGCPDTTSGVIGVAPLPIIDRADSFQDLGRWDVQARMDNFMIEMNHAGPKFRGLVEMTFGVGESRRERVARILNIVQAFRFRKFDMQRIVFAFHEVKDGLGETSLSGVPQGTAREQFIEDNPGVVFVDGPTVMRSPQNALPKRKCDCKC